mgnify:CR=1 FL=1
MHLASSFFIYSFCLLLLSVDLFVFYFLNFLCSALSVGKWQPPVFSGFSDFCVTFFLHLLGFCLLLLTFYFAISVNYHEFPFVIFLKLVPLPPLVQFNFFLLFASFTFMKATLSFPIPCCPYTFLTFNFFWLKWRTPATFGCYI